MYLMYEYIKCMNVRMRILSKLKFHKYSYNFGECSNFKYFTWYAHSIKLKDISE